VTLVAVAGRGIERGSGGHAWIPRLTNGNVRQCSEDDKNLISHAMLCTARSIKPGEISRAPIRFHLTDWSVEECSAIARRGRWTAMKRKPPKRRQLMDNDR